MDQRAAERIVNAIFDELGGRKGIDNELDAIHADAEVYNEMYYSCIKRVLKASKSNSNPKSDHWSPGNE